MKASFWTGWGVAAAMAALHLFLPTGRPDGGVAQAGEARARKALIAEAKPAMRAAATPVAARVEQRIAPPREPWQRGVKVKCNDVNWRPHDKWNVPALYEILGDVPPEVQAVADRIRDAHKSRDLDAALACVDDAEACPNPVVRAMMVDALRLFAMVGDGDDLQESDVARQAAFAAAMRFAADGNEFVAENAVNTLAAATKFIADEETRLGMIAEAIKATGGKILDDFDFEYGVLGRFGVKDEDRDDRLLVVARAIEKLPEGEVRSEAESLFHSATGEKFAGSRGVMEKNAWKDELAEAGTQLFDNDEDKGSEFAMVVDMLTASDANALAGKDAEVEEASKLFANPIAAMRYVKDKESLRKDAVERYGEGPRADAWYERELGFLEKRISEWDERIERSREMRKRMANREDLVVEAEKGDDGE